LADKIDSIFHCGAVVKWTYPYSALKPANVDGTLEILRLAVRGRVKPLHYISTVGVFSSPDFGASAVMESDPLDESGPLYVGYAQTKWVAEKLVTIARSRGLPVWIYRPNLCSDSGTGVYNPHDHISLMLKGCVQSGLTPDLNLRVSGMPVDYAAQAIVLLSRAPAAPNRAYHLVNGSDITWNDFCQWFADQGYPLNRVSFSQWRQGVLGSAKMDRGNALLPLLPFVSEHGFDYARLPRFDSTHTSEQLRAAGSTCPPTDGAILRTWLRYYQKSGFLKAAAAAG
jgi:thioester reductase-like protein